MTGEVCLATRVRYRQSCGLDTWSALLAYLFVSRICVAGLCFCFLLLFYFFPSPPIRSGEAFSSVIFSSLSLLLFVFLDVAMVWNGKPASMTTGSRDRTYVPTFDHSSTLKRRPQTSVTAADLVWVCAPPRTICKWLRLQAFGSCGPGRKILAAAAADLVWVCAPPRTIRKWLRRQAFWILRTRAQDPCSCCLIFRTKVDEKVDNSGWRIEIVADVGIPTKLSDKSGCPVEPFFPAAGSGPYVCIYGHHI